MASTLPDQLMIDFVAGSSGHKDIDMLDVLHAILADVVDSFRLAMSTEDVEGFGDPTFVEPVRRGHIITTVEDYIANNYGED